MTSPRNSKKGREERCRVVSEWKELLLAEAHKDIRLQKRLGNEFPRHEEGTSWWEYCDEQLRIDLRRVGLLLDVKLMIEKIDSSVTEEGRGEAREFECWLRMQRIDFGSNSPFGLVSADQELQRLFPA